MPMKNKRIPALLLCALLMLPFQAALAAEITVERFESGESFVEVAQLSGLEPGFVQDGVNALLLQALSEHLNTLTVIEAGTAGKLAVTADVKILEGGGRQVLAALFTAEGRMPNGRPGYRQTPLMIDLSGAQPLGPDAIFKNPEEAALALEYLAEEAFSEDLSNYLDFSAISPLPLERFLLTGQGITIYYPEGGLTWLSGRAASLVFLYHELADILHLEEGSLLFALGVPGKLELQADSGEQIRQKVEQGILPGLDAALGGDLDALIEKNKLKYDPEGFPEGSAYHLEEDAYRGTQVLSRDGTAISGILGKRMNLFGLVTGKTGREEALAALGQPSAEVVMDGSLAALYTLPAGQMVTYFIGENQLRLHYDSGGILYAVWLQQGTQGAK